jgi:MFS family permease
VRRNRLPLFALIGANAISLIGNMLTAVALPWFVLETTNSPAKAGLTGFAAAIAQFAAGVVGGGVVDRLGFKRSSVISDLVSGVGIVMVPSYT